MFPDGSWETFDKLKTSSCKSCSSLSVFSCFVSKHHHQGVISFIYFSFHLTLSLSPRTASKNIFSNNESINFSANILRKVFKPSLRFHSFSLLILYGMSLIRHYTTFFPSFRNGFILHSWQIHPSLAHLMPYTSHRQTYGRFLCVLT